MIFKNLVELIPISDTLFMVGNSHLIHLHQVIPSSDSTNS